MLECVPIGILKLIYPLKEVNRTRTKPLQVVCLGFSRTGTDSLRKALYELGYSEVHHGFRLSEGDGVGEAVQWYRLGLAKYKYHDASFLTAVEFDKVIGDCEAITDLTGASFGIELLRAYPDAKVVLNRRKDLDRWHRSLESTVGNLYEDWPSWLRSWLDHETFWVVRALIWAGKASFNFDFSRDNVLNIYHKHYTDMEAECKAQGREWLDWTVEDGYGPLCSFLDRDVPASPFPNGNAPDQFTNRRAALHVARVSRARRNGIIVGGGAVAVIIGALAYYYR